jgi:hypothetical protein
LAALVLLGLLFGAKKVAARIVGQFVAVIASLALANVLLKYLEPMDWYKSVVNFMHNETVVNWIFYVLLSGVIYAVIFLLWRLIFNHLIEDMKDSPVVSRIFGAILGACVWAVLLFTVVFFLSALPTWLGSNTPTQLIEAKDYLSRSLISNKLVDLFNSLINLLGATPNPNA